MFSIGLEARLVALIRKVIRLTDADRKAAGAIRARAVELAMEADKRKRLGEMALEYRIRKYPLPPNEDDHEQ